MRPIKLLAALLLSIATIEASESVPRQISDAERFGVEVLARYLDGGPEAVRRVFSPDSGFAALDEAEQDREIEVRLGPTSGSTWELKTVVPSLADSTAVFSVEFPTGIEDTVTFYFDRHGGGFRILDIRTLAEPSRHVTASPRSPAPPTATEPVAPARLPLIAIIVASLLAVPAAVQRHDRHGALALIMSLLFTTGSVAWFLRASRERPETSTPVTSPSQIQSLRLGRLLDLRRAVTEGTSEIVGFDVASVRSDHTLSSIVDLWFVQVALGEMKTDEVVAILDRLRYDRAPLAHILRARLAATTNQESEAILAYERAIDLGPGQDGLWMEAAETFWILGFSTAARSYLDRLILIGSRDASVYYLDSMAHTTGHRDDELRANSSFRTGWNLTPVERREVLRTPRFWSALSDPDIRQMIDLVSVTEPLIMMPTIDDEIVLPSGSEAFVCGKLLVNRVAGSDLYIPGGARMSPVDVPRIDAGDWRRRRQQRAIDDLPRLLGQVATAGAVTQPALRRRLFTTARALLDLNRWSDLVALTRGLSPTDEHVPVRLFLYRARALQRLSLSREAERLLVELLESPVLERTTGFDLWMELGEMLASVERYDLATRALEIASSRTSIQAIDDRIRQFSMESRLASYRHHRTDHFEIRYPEEAGRQKATRMGEILEAEFQRLQKWIPIQDFESTIVHVLSWEEFRRTYTGSDHILAFYDGKIRFPFAEASLMPEIIAIMTHELAHAMIAQATRDQAPHWFHEGVAQHVEPLKYKSNLFTKYDREKIIALSVAEGVLTGYPDPSLTGMAYLESMAFVKFLESRYGRAGLHRMLGSFEAGATGREAVESLSGTNAEELELEFRTWGSEIAPKIFITDETVSYSIDRDEISRERRKLRDGTRR